MRVDLNKNRYLLAIILIIVVVTSVFSGLYWIDSANIRSKQGELLSTDNIITHIRELAQEHRVMGSVGHDRGRDYIIEKIRSFGFEPEIQKVTSFNRTGPDFVKAAVIENIILRLPGDSSVPEGEHGKAILLAGHYDSVPWSLGANDNASAVAIMLEIIRAVNNGPALKNDLVFLFTDGEEDGLLGAKAFATKHPWAEDIGMIINLEARGDGGPSILIQASQMGPWLMKEFGKAIGSPGAYSFISSIFEITPFDSDFTILQELDAPGFNFAYFKGADIYHSSLDNSKNISPKTLKQHAVNAWSLVNHFGNLDLNSPPEPGKMVFFPLFGGIFVSYAQTLVLPLTLFTLIVLLLITTMMSKKKQVSVKGLLISMVFFFGSLIMFVVFSLFIMVLLNAFGSEKIKITLTSPEYSKLYILSFLFFVIGILIFIYNYLLKKVNAYNLALASSITWGLLALVTLVYLPSANYIFLFPLFFNLLGLFILLSREKAGNKSSCFLGATVLLGVGITLLLPLFYLFYLFLGIVVLPIFAVLLVLTFGLAVLPLSMATLDSRKLMAKVSLLLGAFLLVFAVFSLEKIKAHSGYNYISYGFDGDRKQAVWITDSKEIDTWERQFFQQPLQERDLKQFYLKGAYERPLYFNQAPLVKSRPAGAGAIALPKSEILKDVTTKGIRELSLAITSPRQAPLMKVIIESEKPLIELSLDHKRVAPDNGSGKEVSRRTEKQIVEEIIFFNLPPDGLKLDLELDATQNVDLTLVDCSFGLPTALPWKQRKKTIPKDESDFTLVSRGFAY